MAKQWKEISEGERPGYLDVAAKSLIRQYGGNPDDVSELQGMKRLLCSEWGWDPEKYIDDDEVDEVYTDACSE